MLAKRAQEEQEGAQKGGLNLGSFSEPPFRLLKEPQHRSNQIRDLR